MTTKGLRLALFLVCLIGTLSVSAGAQSLDGRWHGNLTCSENLRNGGPGYTTTFDIDVSGASGSGLRSDDRTNETFELKVGSDSGLQLHSEGRINGSATTRWVLRLLGSTEGGERMRLQGSMLAGDTRTLVRERCSVSLQRANANANANANAAQSLPATFERVASSLREQDSVANGQVAKLFSATNHTQLRFREVKSQFKPLTTAQTQAGPGGLPRGQGDALYLPEDWLTGVGQPWHYRSLARQGVAPVPVRAPTPEESRVIEKAETLMQRIESRVMVFMADGAIVDAISTGGIQFNSRLFSASMGKTVTALAAGKAVCEGQLSLDQRVDSVLPTLAGTDLGSANLRHVLTMSSGTTEPGTGDVHGILLDEMRHYLEGTGNLEQLLATPRNSSAQRTLFGKVKPGERFSYKSRDPYTVAMMIERSVGMPTTQWIEEKLLRAFDAEYPVILGTDKSGYFHGAAGSVRMTLVDWVRFALWVERLRRADDCMGRFLKEMGSIKIPAPGVMNSSAGYGYLTWTDNAVVPNTFWAAGYGGQRIAWSTDPANQRVFMLFSNSADRNADQIYPIAREWMDLGRLPR